MAYGSTHTATIPTVSSTVGPTYASQVNAALAEIHATLDVKVTPAGMDMNANLSFLSGGSYYALTNVERMNLQNKGAAINATTYPVALYAVSGDLYFNDNSGRQVRVTNGGALNIAATGGITGAGYGSGGVEVNWAVADLAYKLKSGAATYASAWMNDLYLNDGDTNFVRITAQAMAADYALTLPAALPGSTSLLTLSSAGAIAASRDPSVDTVTTTGNTTVGGSLAVAGATTYSGVISPAAIGSTTNNWAPTGFATCSVIRISTSASFDLTGLAGGAAGRTVSLVNLSVTDTVTLQHADAGSSAANQFILPNTFDYALGPRETITLWYDDTTSVWRALSTARP